MLKVLAKSCNDFVIEMLLYLQAINSNLIFTKFEGLQIFCYVKIWNGFVNLYNVCWKYQNWLFGSLVNM